MDKGKLDLKNRTKKKGNTTKVIAGSENKDKGFSVKTTPSTFDKFSRINQYYGMSNNSVINMLITKYIQDNKHILDE